ncbi:hypothetical protein [Thiorhodospira sibirica]|uniref:hypothetical protein n=1 Tax=Thiorhodospira sibirica TaxID=154347 RepID=UPI00022C1D42|nr:hypothetical protein [Thiorhodospira sibirica]
MNWHATIRIFVLSALLIPALALAQPGTLSLTVSPELATAGFYRLSWEGSAHSHFELHESQHPEFHDYRVLYSGPDTASVQSGRADGVYYYRLSTPPQADDDPALLSDIVAVTVQHHSLGRALSFFALGAVVFAALLIVIAFGTRQRHV